jgi:hypothetical protein
MLLLLCLRRWDNCLRRIAWVIVGLFAGVQQKTNCSLSDLVPKFEGSVFLSDNLIPVSKDLGSVWFWDLQFVGVELCHVF